MVIEAKCSDCRRKYRLGDELAGKKIRCKECGSVVSVGRPIPKAPRQRAPSKRARERDAEPRQRPSRSDRAGSSREVTRRKPNRRKKQGGLSPLMIGGGAVAAVLVLGIGGCMIFGGGSDDPGTGNDAVADGGNDEGLQAEAGPPEVSDQERAAWMAAQEKEANRIGQRLSQTVSGVLRSTKQLTDSLNRATTDSSREFAWTHQSNMMRRYRGEGSQLANDIWKFMGRTKPPMAANAELRKHKITSNLQELGALIPVGDPKWAALQTWHSELTKQNDAFWGHMQ